MINNPAPKRVMWLLNHGEARNFEIAMLKAVGFNEIFLPKIYPLIPNFRSASIDFSEDQHLTIPAQELAILNQTNWYESPSKKAWLIANKYFDVLFFIVFYKDNFHNILNNFKGMVLQRAYGLHNELNYGKLLGLVTQNTHKFKLERAANRYWFAHAYASHKNNEQGIIHEKALFLPLGLLNTQIQNSWTGSRKEIFFICPSIELCPYYRAIYQKFIKDFQKFPFKIGGFQPLKINAEHVTGYLSKEDYEDYMRTMRVMFYHSTELHHIHYHPFEAIRGGMPLIFMGGGLLDSFGGKKLPGRCKNINEARKKIKRILNDDWNFINEIRQSQMILLEPMEFKNCLPDWQRAFAVIDQELELLKNVSSYQKTKAKRIAIILPQQYRGGNLYQAQLLARAISLGGQHAQSPVQVIFAYPDNDNHYIEEDFLYLDHSIKRRPYRWNIMNNSEARLAMAYAKQEAPLYSPEYIVPNDGINYFMDCDLWIIISDRLSRPLLPLKPHLLMVNDYIQRYEPTMKIESNELFVARAHAASGIMVTTEFTLKDAISFAGLPPHKVHKVPMLLPIPNNRHTKSCGDVKYFIWTTNLESHKNHLNAIKALERYYKKYQGQLQCFITGVNSHLLLNNQYDHLQSFIKYYEEYPFLESSITIKGELSYHSYQALVAEAMFLWHPTRLDNGTFSIIDAACAGIPTLSSHYPAMEEMVKQFNLNCFWMNACDVEDMAYQLKQMELLVLDKSLSVSLEPKLIHHSPENLAENYWQVVEEYL